ncbi:MAG TPA: galactosyldiacylglycerol synthase [Firmicutes bacterium]|nr:galactosyldiacylglycerol synthase [Bacillota bacterium]
MNKNVNKKILILSASAGGGHTQAAEALVKTAQRDFPNSTVVHKDILDLSPKYFKRFYAGIYKWIVKKHHTLWHYIYHLTDKQPIESLSNKIRRFFERTHTFGLDRFIKDFTPDAIICTHFMPVEIFSKQIRQNRLNIPVWVQITDFDAHRFWLHPHMNGYFAANDEVAHRLEAYGIEKDRITVAGIPIRPQFSDKLSRTDCARELNLNPDKPTLLLMAGGEGVIELDKIAERLLNKNTDLQVITVCGKNKKLFGRMQAVSDNFKGRIANIGFSTEIEKLMTASDFAVTKAGGLTTSECLAMGLPMIIISPIPGQEERNAFYVTETGAALVACDLNVLEMKVKMLSDNKELLKSMKKNALKISRPFAAQKVLKTVLGI